jgi:ribonuclease BN (tRNA processing enzyme)
MFDVRFYGVRGSYCTPGKAMASYGGSTSCVVISRKNKAGLTVPLVLDCGNGGISAGHAIAAGIKAGTTTPAFTVLFTHLHHDHIEGIPFFSPLFMPQAHIFLGGKEESRYPLSAILPRTMELPFFPVKFDALSSKRTFFAAEKNFFISQDGEPVPENEAPVGDEKAMLFKINVFASSTRFHPEPGSLYYRVTDCEDGASLACVWDIEAVPTDETIRGEYEALVNFAKNVDFLIYDTMYTAEEYACAAPSVKGYGHSTYEMALETAARASAKKAAAFHYNPVHTDSFLDRIA